MEHRRLGRTGLDVSVLGLGTGGANQFGQKRGASPAEATALVRTALDLGVNYFDTAHAYGLSEDLLGAALQGVPRDSYYVATKYSVADQSGAVISAEAVEAAITLSLRRLRVDWLDVIQIHGLRPAPYDQVISAHMPTLVRARERGLVRSIGITESFAGEVRGGEALLGKGIAADVFDGGGWWLRRPQEWVRSLSTWRRNDVVGVVA